MMMDKVEQAVIELNGNPRNADNGCHCQTRFPVLACMRGNYIWSAENSINANEYRICTYSEFMETRRRLENKPGWDEHDWPQMFFYDGSWWGVRAGWSLKDNIYEGFEGKGVDLLHGDGERLCLGRYFGDWEQSLERRPESKEDQEAEPESVEWVPGVDLPPVGTKCKLWESRWVSGPFDAVELSAGAEVEIGGHANFGGFDVACFARDGRTGTAVPDCFAPIQSHREKVIEAAFEVGASRTPVLDSHVRLVVEALAEEDMLKLPEDQK